MLIQSIDYISSLVIVRTGVRKQTERREKRIHHYDGVSIEMRSGLRRLLKLLERYTVFTLSYLYISSFARYT